MKKRTREPISYEEIAFLRESNNIENEWDDLSLQQAIHAWDYALSEKKMTQHVVLQTHKILMLHHLVGDKKGYFRREPVGMYLGDGAFKEFKPWYVIPELIENWCQKMNSPADAAYAKMLHIEYEAIHPFVDGNGRTGRIFYNWHRVKNGLPIEIILEKEKQEYYKWFRNK